MDYTKSFRSVSPASEELIAKLEAKLGTPIPADYKEYLRTSNGGISSKPCYRGEIRNIYVQSIYKLKDTEEEGLLWEIKAASVPKTFEGLIFPIATVDGGDHLFLSLVNGELFFWSHEENTYELVEESFEKLFSRMYEEFGDD